jgi:hypothetical protein
VIVSLVITAQIEVESHAEVWKNIALCPRTLNLKDPKWELWSIVAIAALLRVAALGNHSLLFDEAFVAIGARDIAWNHTPMWDAISNAPFVAVLSLIVRAFGDSATVLRMLPAIAGTASVYVIYILQRRFFGRTTALLGTLLFAVHPFAVAFSRILFADPLQLLFVLVGWLLIDRYAMADLPGRRKWLLLEIVFVWALAFLMKYNAIVPGGIWILAGWLGGRYRLRTCIVASIAVLLGPALTLLIWPYDAPFWFAAYLRQGGNYDVTNAAQYFAVKLRLIFFGLTPFVTAAAIVIRFRRPTDHTRATALFAIYSIAYVITVIALGRTFERYLLVVVPALCMTVAGLTNWLWNLYRQTTAKLDRRLAAGALIIIAAGISIGMTVEYVRYAEYLGNDVDMQQIAHRTITERQTPGSRVFWYVAEPIAGYYLGFSRDYSRAIAADTTMTGSFNYFDGRTVSHSADRSSYHVLDIRQFARHQGVGRIVSDPSGFLDSVRRLSTRQLMRVPTCDYFTDSVVRSGDLLVLQSGMLDLQGEPLLQRADTASPPPMISRLPGGFDVVAVYRPEGPAPITDTIPTKYRAGLWILRKR